MKENNTGQTVYEQLQEFFYSCIDGGYICKFIDSAITNTIIMFSELGIKVTDEYGSGPLYYSYHDLFSKDSGIMERVEWKDNHSLMLRNMNDKKKYHYMIMGPMTKEEKIQYFLSNAKLQIKSE